MSQIDVIFSSRLKSLELTVSTKYSAMELSSVSGQEILCDSSACRTWSNGAMFAFHARPKYSNSPEIN